MATDVMHDRGYLTTLLSHANPRLRHQAQQALESLDREEARGIQQQQFGEQIAARRQAHEENVAQRELGRQNLETYRESMLAQREEGQKARDTALMMHLMENPGQLEAMGYSKEQANALMQNLVNKQLSKIGIQPGAAAPDRLQQAVTQFAASRGEPVAPAAATPPIAQAAAGTPATPTGGGATVGGGADTEGLPTRAVTAPLADRIRAVAPPGMSYNVSTGEWIPSGTPGTINARPAGEVIAEGALRTGIAPESVSGTAALAQLRRAGVPSFEHGLPTRGAGSSYAEEGAAPAKPTTAAAPTPQGASFGERVLNWINPKRSYEPLQAGDIGGRAPASQPAAPPAWSPEQLAEGKRPMVGPTPEPTPGVPPVPGPFSGSFGNVTQGPLPTPAGTPPPTPAALSDEELKRRLAQQGQ